MLKSTQNFDLGIIVLTGAGPYTATVSLNRSSTFNCDGNSGNVDLLGHAHPRQYNVAGTQQPERDDRVGPGAAQRRRRAHARR